MTSEPGPLAEEAFRLIEAVQHWTAGYARAGAGLGGLDGMGHASECRLCPVCQLLSWLRGMRPEVFEHLADAAGSLLAAVQAVAEASAHSWARQDRPPVQHIHVG